MSVIILWYRHAGGRIRSSIAMIYMYLFARSGLRIYLPTQIPSCWMLIKQWYKKQETFSTSDKLQYRSVTSLTHHYAIPICCMQIRRCTQPYFYVFSVFQDGRQDSQVSPTRFTGLTMFCLWNMLAQGKVVFQRAWPSDVLCRVKTNTETSQKGVCFRRKQKPHVLDEREMTKCHGKTLNVRFSLHLMEGTLTFWGRVPWHLASEHVFFSDGAMTWIYWSFQ